MKSYNTLWQEINAKVAAISVVKEQVLLRYSSTANRSFGEYGKNL